jgi:hypothetical protein
MHLFKLLDEINDSNFRIRESHILLDEINDSNFRIQESHIL